MRLQIFFLLCVNIVLGRRCLPFKYVTNGSKCGDNSRAKGIYCGVGRCNVFGTRCKGGCRNSDGLEPLKTGDVVMCTKSGTWKGSLAVNQTHVAYPAFDRGFTRIVQGFKAASHSHLGRFCRVETALFDHYAQLLGYTPKNITATNVNIFSSSWELQVTYWKYGVAFDPSELLNHFGVYKEEYMKHIN